MTLELGSVEVLLIVRERKQQQRGDGCESVIKMANSRCLRLYSAYTISFNTSKVGKYFWS